VSPAALSFSRQLRLSQEAKLRKAAAAAAATATAKTSSGWPILVVSNANNAAADPLHVLKGCLHQRRSRNCNLDDGRVGS